jgi:hypothetical protein
MSSSSGTGRYALKNMPTRATLSRLSTTRRDAHFSLQECIRRVAANYVEPTCRLSALTGRRPTDAGRRAYNLRLKGEERSVNNQGTALATVGDDTIELQLTTEDLLGLAHAAEAAELALPAELPAESADELPVESPAPTGAQDYTAPPLRVGSKTSVVEIACSAAAFAAFALFVWWSVDHLFGQPPAPAMAANSRSSSIARAATPAMPSLSTSSQQASVLVRNPFDRTEVFEFPAGTSKAESREKVAALLLQRARERRSQWNASKPAQNLRAANLYRAP